MKPVFPRRALSLALAAALLALAFALSGCSFGTAMTGDKNVLPRTYKLSAAAEYSLSISGIASGALSSFRGQVTLDPSLGDEMVITTDDNVFTSFKVNVSDDGKITVSGDSKYIYEPSELEITVGAKVAELSVSDSFDVTAAVSDIPSFAFTSSGSTALTLTCGKLDVLTLDLTGGCSATLEGAASEFDVTLTGAAVIKAYKLVSTDATLALTGAADAEVNVTGTLEASITGTSNVHYRGDPKKVVPTVDGVGVIEAAKD